MSTLFWREKRKGKLASGWKEKRIEAISNSFIVIGETPTTPEYQESLHKHHHHKQVPFHFLFSEQHSQKNSNKLKTYFGLVTEKETFSFSDIQAPFCIFTSFNRLHSHTGYKRIFYVCCIIREPEANNSFSSRRLEKLSPKAKFTLDGTTKIAR